MIEFEDLTDVILVGWSYGGMVVTGVADSLPRTFIRFPVNGEAFASLFDPIAERFLNNPQWHYKELQTNHCGPLIAPELVSEALINKNIL